MRCVKVKGNSGILKLLVIGYQLSVVCSLLSVIWYRLIPCPLAYIS